MTKYITFLKFKQNEIQALGTLEEEILNEVTPLFDIPRTKKILTEEEIINRIELGEKQLSNLYDEADEHRFYIDNHDLDDSIDLNNTTQYRYILNRLSDYNLIPILAFDRHPDHNQAGLDYIAEHGGSLAIRLQAEDLESYNLTKPLLLELWETLEELSPDEVHLLIDQRVITDIDQASRLTKSFLTKFVQDFEVDLIATIGSIIPANIAELLSTEEELHTDRLEWQLWKNVKKSHELSDVLFGDYGVVSPDYSDAEFDPRLFRKISAPKVFYPYNNNFFVVRGASFQSHPKGNGQYFDIADCIVAQPFYREDYSAGDEYIFARSNLSPKKPAKAGSPGSWIKATLAAHITYIVRSI